MKWGIGAGPAGAENHLSTVHVYDARDGRMLGTFHFVGSAKEFGEEHRHRIAKQIHEASEVPLEHIRVLSGAELPEGEGPLSVDTKTGRLVRTSQPAPRIRA